MVMIKSLYEQKRDLEGSPTRDRFKLLHKQLLPRFCYALDSDLELVAKHPAPRVIARLDFKCLGDRISFTEGIAYNFYSEMGIAIFIIEAQHPSYEFTNIGTDEHRFNVYRYKRANWIPDPPVVEQELVAERLTWDGLKKWEISLRNGGSNA